MKEPKNLRDVSKESIAEWILMTMQSDLDFATKKYIIGRILRRMGSYKPLRVSHAAQDVGTRMGLGDLHKYLWSEQPTLMKDPGRKIFHFEHKIPIIQIIENMLRCRSVSGIVKQMNKIEIAIILKAEDKKLNEGKDGVSWRNKRPDNAYEQLGIELIEL